ncbi:MAG: DUF58 domain-containing protein [Deltaproteobacteria bacterium]|nr:DUF58 domain-containing protein [Deltaproteobacteria bacterium]
MSAGSYRYFDAETLAKLSGLRLRVQEVVDGAFSGIHRAVHRGSTVEFAEHKEYTPGDDLRRLDWKAYAKFDRFYVREFEAETELRAFLLLDRSASMGYGAPLTKLEYGSVLVGSLASILARQGDRPALMAYAKGVDRYLPPRARSQHLGALLGALEVMSPAGETCLERALTQLSELVGRRSLVVVVSDLFGVEEGALAILRELRARQHRVVVVHLLHRDEIEFPFERLTVFKAMESQRELLVDPPGVRRRYLKELESFCHRVREACQRGRVEYLRVSTSEAVDGVLRHLMDPQHRPSAALEEA